MSELNDFIKMSRYAGMREDLVQAGGGNSSVKIREEVMYIKASGTSMAEMDTETGYSVVNPVIIRQFLEQDDYSCTDGDILLSQSVIKGLRPSIETFLHAVTEKFTLHTHPVLVNALTARQGGMEQLHQLFPAALLVGYATPGMELAKIFNKDCLNAKKKNGLVPSVIFLKNHGLIVHGSDALWVIEKTEEIILKLADFLGEDISPYTMGSRIWNTYFSSNGQTMPVVYLAQNRELEKAAKILDIADDSHAFCPDSIVYCGKKIMVMNEETPNESQKLFDYFKRYGQTCVIYDSKNLNFYIVAGSMKKAREIESVLSFSCQVAALNQEYPMDYLTDEEQDYLLHWDLEQYRKNMQ